MNQWVGKIGSPIDIEVLEESALAQAQATIESAIKYAGVSRADLARRMDCHRSFVTRMMSGDHNLTVKTMTRALAACGFEVEFKRVPIIWNWERPAVADTSNVHPVSVGLPTPASAAGVGRFAFAA